MRHPSLSNGKTNDLHEDGFYARMVRLICQASPGVPGIVPLHPQLHHFARGSPVRFLSSMELHQKFPVCYSHFVVDSLQIRLG